jgi:Protein of unknown function (DUF3341)
MKALVARFEDSEGIVAAAGTARSQGFPVLDALTPFPLEDLDPMTGATVSPRLRGPMALAGFGLAFAFFLFESWTAVFAYPFNEGGRPLFSWPAFLLSPFEVGILAAALAGFGVFLYRAGLPGLNHSIFGIPGIERASQDRFFLVLDPVDADKGPALQKLLFESGATMVSEVEL